MAYTLYSPVDWYAILPQAVPRACVFVSCTFVLFLRRLWLLRHVSGFTALLELSSSSASRRAPSVDIMSQPSFGSASTAVPSDHE